ncbi:hypothetical protein Pyn_10181 [Prunus yedoensis var. nudiflora]|uniref:Uncharacterized protein n=1 Tax=Prunus yedoensis var. nudiflora TaxID=2094558 RepID=A0A314YWT4_PRUYE|nr:hypothetical protein Pyn_10181 [Prunus yedoensis var. nudiflora]
MDPKVRVAHNYCKHGDVHDHPCGTCRDLFDVGPDNVQYYRSRPLLPHLPLFALPPDWCEDCYNDKRILDWEERGRFESSDDFDAITKWLFK